MKLSTDQTHALDMVMQFLVDPAEQEMAIWGPAGTGKTVLTKYILRQARKQASMLKLLMGADHKLNTVLTSTTNKAAKVLADATGEQARTIHSLLGLRVYNDYSTGQVTLKRSKDSDVIQNTLIVIDEASMINRELLTIIRSLTHKCKVLYIGDSYQLAPVMENISPVFSDVSAKVELKTIQRQIQGSPIIQFATQFRDALDTGNFPHIQGNGKELIYVDGDDFQSLIDITFPCAEPNDARIMAWTNNRVHQYNSYIRHISNAGDDYQLGERVLTNQPILMESGKTIFTTDTICTVTGIAHAEKEHIKGWEITLNNKVRIFQAYAQADVVAYLRGLKAEKNWPKYFAVKDGFADIRPIHACTVNKAQGSTYGEAFIDLTDIGKCTKNSDIIRMLYTAVTRAKDKVIMTGTLPKRLYE